MITDLVQIRQLEEKKRDENSRLRKFMKTNGENDRVLRGIAQDIEDQIDCTQCANCCKVATATVSVRDIEHLARYLRTTPAKFVADYTMQSEEEVGILKRTAEAGGG